ncbi:hypothetical protein [Streptomyces sp. NPDC046976]|uniref:hypothetical protein n=1 Tax=Streptomyces sp. NPDC046976 TaxID=3155258 RepID=UPI003402F86E
MTPPVTAASSPMCPAVTLAEHVAALLPARAGIPWTVEPYAPWWTTIYPGARLVQGARALVLVARPSSTHIGWQLHDREPYRPDLRLESVAPARIAREVLRLVLPVADDEAARAHQGYAADHARLGLLCEIGTAMRTQGAATYERGGLLVNTSTVSWASSGLRYSAALHGSNPVADVQIEGPVRAVERTLTRFLPDAVPAPPVVPTGIQGRLERRMAQVLARHGHVEQFGRKGLSFGAGPGPYGRVAPSFDADARAHDTAPASVDVHGVGVDFLVSLAPHVAR